jgi:hypothetical protein
MGAVLVLVGAVVAVLAVLVGALGVPTAVLTAGVVAAVVAVAGVGVLLARATSVVRLGDDGYSVRLLRRPGVRRARWRDVEDVVTATLSGHPCVVIRLRDGGTTTVPLTAVDASPEVFLRDLREHLDRGHGYRRIR